MRPAILAALAVVLLATSAAAQQPVVRTAPEPAAPSLPSIALPPELDRVLRDYERAWQARDAGALARLFTEDGFVLPNGQPPRQGTEALARHYDGSGGPLHLRALGYAAGDTVGYIVGAYAERAGDPDIGKFVLALRRVPGGPWRIAADIDNASRMARPRPPARDSTARP